MRTHGNAIRRRLATTAVAAGLGLAAGGVQAVTINGDFRSDGESFDVFGGQAGAAPQTTGGGSLNGVFDAAAGVWEQAIQDNATYSVNYGWSDLGGNTLGRATRYTDRSNRNARILFDNSGTDWFADPTPNDNSEFGDFRESSQTLGGGSVNTGRVYNAASGDAARRLDLLTVATHELGHALGFLNLGGDFGDGRITVGGDLPNSGTRIDVGAGGHMNPRTLPNTLMRPTVSPGERTLISAIDVLGTAEVNGFSQVDLDPATGDDGGDDGGGGNDEPSFNDFWQRLLALYFGQGGFNAANASHAEVPAPAPVALLGAGLIGLAGMRRRRARAG